MTPRVFAMPSVTEAKTLSQRHSGSYADEQATQEQGDKSMQLDPQDQEKNDCHPGDGRGDKSWLVDKTTHLAQPPDLLGIQAY